MTSTPAGTLDRIVEERVVLCVRLSAGDVVSACRAAARGGLRILEITLTTPGALDAIRTLAAEPGLLVGAGTVLTVSEVRAVADAGGRFALSPVFDPEVVDAVHARGLLAVPGSATPTEIHAAWRHGARLVKVFPAGAVGGPGFLRAVRGPLPDVPILATNGPDSTNLADYLGAGAVAVGVGAEVFSAGFTEETIEAAARRTRAAADGAA